MKPHHDNPSYVRSPLIPASKQPVMTTQFKSALELAGATTDRKKMIVQIIFSFVLVFLCESIAAVDQVILRWNPEDTSKPAEGITVWVRDDGGLLADFGLRTTDQLLETCDDWRRKGTEPALRIVLFPKLEVNRDLGVIWPLMSALKEKDIAFELLIADPDADPHDDLVTKQGQGAGRKQRKQKTNVGPRRSRESCQPPCLQWELNLALCARPGFKRALREEPGDPKESGHAGISEVPAPLP